jgi:bifunctional DNase/RNase
MIPVDVRAITWCTAHGHPVVVLGFASDDEVLGVAVTAGDAQALARQPGAAAERSRLYDLVDWLLDELGGRLLAIDLSADEHSILRATLRIAAQDGAIHAVPAGFADAVVLAQRTGRPIGIKPVDLARLRGSDPRPAEPTGNPEAVSAEQRNGLDAFRPFIESLDLDGLSHGAHEA